MKLPLRSLLPGLLLFAAAACAQDFAAQSPAAPVAPSAAADTDYAAWQRTQRQGFSRGKEPLTKEQSDQFWRDKVVELDGQTEKFLAAHPQDSRRWEVMLRPIQMARWRVFADEPARAAAEARDLDRLRAIMAAADAPADIAEQANAAFIQRSLEAARAAYHQGVAPDTAGLAALLDAFAARAPASRMRSQLEQLYLGLLGEADPAAADLRLRKLAADTANPAVAEMAGALADKAGYRGRAIEMKFTAADGRPVDLAQLRGKVVLVDFWATWCGPCMNEMPNVKAAYAKYHDQGFEVIGVSLDGTDIHKGIQSGVKTKELFLAFLKREQMPWPQHYDNLGWKNEFALKFRIKGIPAVFLLGRDGKVLSTDARGENLEPQVRAALGLPRIAAAPAPQVGPPRQPAPTPAATERGQFRINTPGIAPRAPGVPLTEADRAYDAFKNVLATPPPEPREKMGTVKYYTWLEGQRLKAQASGLEFYARYSSDVRLWDVVLSMIKSAPLYLKDWGPDAEKAGISAVIIDEKAQAAWERKSNELAAAVLATPDIPAVGRESLEWAVFARDFRAALAAMKQGRAVDWTAFRTRFDTHAVRYAGLDILAARAGDYLGAMERARPGATAAEWQHLLDVPNGKLHAKAMERVAFFASIAQPLEISFTAADGRAVDLAKLRGKVVLVDFWATWCGPCKAELPNVVANYRKYHGQGFEVVGIALENASLAQKDTPDEAAAKLAKARKVLADFTAANDMPWPQYFDGKFWKNDISTRYAVHAIPAMFLLDQAGRVVSTDARGEKLEAEVKRLLKL